jgi:hypothetical protein
VGPQQAHARAFQSVGGDSWDRGRGAHRGQRGAPSRACVHVCPAGRAAQFKGACTKLPREGGLAASRVRAFEVLACP